MGLPDFYDHLSPEDRLKLLLTIESRNNHKSRSSFWMLTLTVIGAIAWVVYNNIETVNTVVPIEPQVLVEVKPKTTTPANTGKIEGVIWKAGKLNNATVPITGNFAYGFTADHPGLDIAAPVGSQVLAVKSGEVIVSGWDDFGLGNYIVLKHPDNTFTIYGHNSELKVKVGDRVKEGDVIALSGSSGNSIAPHLHLELALETLSTKADPAKLWITQAKK